MDTSRATIIEAEIIGLNFNETFTQATLYFKDGSDLQFVNSKEMGGWMKASDGQNTAKEVARALLDFQLNSTYLWLRFEDGSQLRFRDANVATPPDRRTSIMLILFLLIVACIPVFVLIIRDSWSVNTWIGLAIGVGLGSPFYIRSIRSMRSENPADIAPQKVEKSADLFFMSIIVIIALFIGVIWFFIGEAGREMVYMILAGLVTGSMSSLAFIIWRYLPED